MTVRSTTTVLVLVKAAPQPSSTYGETVCVAGLEGPAERPSWLRLYPVPFRYLDGERQFRKYDLVEVTTRDAGGDKRPESRKITADSIKNRHPAPPASTPRPGLRVALQHPGRS